MKLHKKSVFHMSHGKTLLHLDLEDMEAAGFRTDGLTEDKFNEVWHNLARYYDANWLELVSDACESAGMERNS